MPKKNQTPAEKAAWGAKELSIPLRSSAYRSVHLWIERVLGQPNDCSKCGDKQLNHRQYHWANKSGEYKRDIDDWYRLCVACHKAFDGFGLSTGFCRRGHSIEVVGFYVKPGGYKQCRKCKNLAKHRKIELSLARI